MRYQRLTSEFPTKNSPATTANLGHQSNTSIDEAARWYRANRETVERPLIPALRRRFGLTAHEAVTAIREARQLR